MTLPLAKLTGMLCLSLSLLLLGGCEEAAVELHEPGVYKGKPDPLLQHAGTPEHHEQLRKRMAQVQTDR